jgi:dihydropteroate synthase
MHQPETVASVSASAPRLIGIVNITEDPFSDGGRYLAPAAALTPSSCAPTVPT